MTNTDLVLCYFILIVIFSAYSYKEQLIREEQ